MGAIHRGVPADLCSILQALSGAKLFVETGTNKGTTAAWAAARFERVWTIEAHDEQYRRARSRLASMPNIQVVHGESQSALKAFMIGVSEPAICWLDAHWSGAGTAGESYQCPVIAEIEAVDHSTVEHIVLIDDARLFLRPHAPPFEIAHWPTLPGLMDSLRVRWPNTCIVVVDDVIVRVPRRFAEAFQQAVRMLPDPADLQASRRGRSRPMRAFRALVGFDRGR